MIFHRAFEHAPRMISDLCLGLSCRQSRFATAFPGSIGQCLLHHHHSGKLNRRKNQKEHEGRDKGQLNGCNTFAPPERGSAFSSATLSPIGWKHGWR